MKASWFERHPKKTLMLLVLVVVLALTYITEKILAARFPATPETLKRCIRLRELEPFHLESIIPPPEALTLNPGGSELRAVLLRADRQGFIMPSEVHARPDVTLAFLGGSTTECRVLDEKVRFPYFAAQLLEQETKLKLNSYNASRSGNNSLHSINILVNKILPLNPQAVVMMHNINDLVTLVYEKTYWNEHASRRPVEERKPTISKNLKEILALIRQCTIPNIYRSFKTWEYKIATSEDEFREVRGKATQIDQSYLCREFQRNLEIFLGICRASGTAPVLMTQPNRLIDQPDRIVARQMKILEPQGISYQDFKQTYDLFNQTIREVGARQGALVVDLARQVPQDAAHMYDLVHLTDRGSQLVAQLLAAQLRPLVISQAK
jgi:hypothetical protein